MDHSFDIEFAKEHGMKAAVIYRNFQYWIAKNRANGHNIREGRAWTYNSLRALADLFPYMSVWDVRKALDKLIKSEILIKKILNSKRYDKTAWYAFADEKTALRGFPAHLWNSHRARKSHTGLCESHTPIPIPNPNTNPDKNKPIGKTAEEILALDLKIADQKKFLAFELSKTFGYLTKGEKQTFRRVLDHLVKITQNDPNNMRFFKEAAEWAHQAKVSNASNQKGLFVAKVKQETGFRGQKRLLKK